MKAASLVAFASLAGLASCQRPYTATMIAAPPPIPQEQLIAPPSREPSLPPVISRDTSVALTVNVDTHGRETDVRELLTFLGQAAGVHFVFSPQINKRIRITLLDVPISTAIQAVLAEAALTLEGTTSMKPPPTPAVVFYQLPVEIDSLSVESIMKRFGVGRAVAEILVISRPEKP